MFGSLKGSPGGPPARPSSALWQATGLGLVLGAATLVGALLGQYLDRRWATSPWLTLAGTLLGMLAGLFEVIGVLKGIESAETRRRE
jgi:F0F1-type ATP synthase assembly protein I